MENNKVFINGQWVTKPTRGKCAYCGSDLLEFYDDGTGICLNCGRTFSWLRPLSGPVTPAQRAPPEKYPPRMQSPAYASTPQAPPRRPAPPPRENYPAYAVPQSRPPARKPRTSSKKVKEYPEETNTKGGFPEGPGFLSPKAISIMAFIGALLLGIGAIITILAMPMGSWPKLPTYGDPNYNQLYASTMELIGNLRKIGMIIWASGTMIFLMAGFAAAGTREMNYRVRATLIASSVALAILSFSLWLGMAIMTSGFYHP